MYKLHYYLFKVLMILQELFKFIHYCIIPAEEFVFYIHCIISYNHYLQNSGNKDNRKYIMNRIFVI